MGRFTGGNHLNINSLDRYLAGYMQSCRIPLLRMLGGTLTRTIYHVPGYVDIGQGPPFSRGAKLCRLLFKGGRLGYHFTQGCHPHNWTGNGALGLAIVT